MKYAIIGNSYAAIGAVEGIHAVDKSGEITIFSDEPHLAYARPLISYFVEGRVPSEKMYYRTADFYKKHSLNHVLGQSVTKVDAQNQTISLADGASYTYDKLLVCSGSKPYIPPIKGIEAKGVMGFKKWEDAMELQNLASTKKKAIILGGGLVGLKATEGLRNMGLDVSIVSRGSRALHLILDQEAGEMVNERIRNSGVKLITGFDPVEILSNEHGEVRGLVLENGEKLECDILVVGKGVRPNVEFLDESGVEIDYGIVVDRHMRSSVENIYAAGDVAEAWDILNRENSVIAIAPLAFEQGRVAGYNMAGREHTYAGGISMNSIEVFKLSVMCMGAASKPIEGTEEAVYREGDIYRKLVIKDGKLIGAILVGEVDYGGVLTALIRSESDISEIREELTGVTLESGNFISVLPRVGDSLKAGQPVA